MQQIFSKCTPFLLGFALLLPGLVWVLLGNKGDAELAINQLRQPIFDSFFRYYTHFGDGLFFIGLAAIFLLVHFRRSLFLLVCFGLSGALAQLLKRLVFSTQVRPKLYFEQMGISADYVEGVAMATQHSFPSGHSTSAFALACALCILLPKRWHWQISLLLLASLACFSRVYLLQHFFVDIYAGAILGIGSTFLCIYLAKALKLDAFLGIDQSLFSKDAKRQN